MRYPQKRLSSMSLGPKAQQFAAAEQMPLLSAIDDGAWGQVDKGWELREKQDRESEVRRRRERAERVFDEFAGSDPLKVARRTEEIARLRAGIRVTPATRWKSSFGNRTI